MIVDAKKKKVSLEIRELIKYKDLFLILAYRDYRVRYAQTYLGFIWALIQPALTLLIFILVFDRAANIDTGDIPYPIFAVTGMSAWAYFSFVMSQSGNSIINAQNMIKKIYFPRLVIPLAKGLVGIIDFFIVFIFLVVLMIVYEYPLSTKLLFLPFFVVANIISALATGIWLSALSIRYRDFQHIIPFAVQLGLYVTPIAYPTNLLIDRIPNWLAILYYLNPIAGVVEGFRFCILGVSFTNSYIYISFAVILILFISGLIYFKKVERVMADII